jgi:hypothetical protein
VTSTLPKLPYIDAAWFAIPIAFLIYVLLLHDARRRDSPAAGDDQLGIKTVAATLAVVSTWIFATGLHGFLQAFLTFDDFGARLKVAMPSLLVGALGVVSTALILFPRTNAAQHPKAKRLAVGLVALISGIAMLPALVDVLTQVFDWPSWRLVATALATAIDAGLIFVVSLAVLGKLCGVRMPERLGRSAGAAGPGSYGGPQPGPGYGVQPLQSYPGTPMQPPAQGYAAPPVQPPGPGGYPPQG